MIDITWEVSRETVCARSASFQKSGAEARSLSSAARRSSPATSKVPPERVDALGEHPHALTQLRNRRRVDLRHATASLRSGHYMKLGEGEVSHARNTIMGVYPTKDAAATAAVALLTR